VETSCVACQKKKRKKKLKATPSSTKVIFYYLRYALNDWGSVPDRGTDPSLVTVFKPAPWSTEAPIIFPLK
jgi:hypothetical protein